MGAATASHGAAWTRPRRAWRVTRARTSRAATAAAQGGADEAGPGRGKGGAHGVSQGAAMCTLTTDGEERRRGGGATTTGGAGGEAPPRAEGTG